MDVHTFPYYVHLIFNVRTKFARKFCTGSLLLSDQCHLPCPTTIPVCHSVAVHTFQFNVLQLILAFCPTHLKAKVSLVQSHSLHLTNMFIVHQSSVRETELYYKCFVSGYSQFKGLLLHTSSFCTLYKLRWGEQAGHDPRLLSRHQKHHVTEHTALFVVEGSSSKGRTFPHSCTAVQKMVS